MSDLQRPFLRALLFEKDGDLNLSYIYMGIYSLIGIIVVLWTIIINPASVIVQVSALSFLGAAFMGLLITGVPIAKAKILARSSLPSDIAKGIASAGQNVTASTDISELWQKEQNNNETVG